MEIKPDTKFKPLPENRENKNINYFENRGKEMVKKRKEMEVIFKNNKTGYFTYHDNRDTSGAGYHTDYHRESIFLSFDTKDFPKELRGVTDGNLAEAKPTDGKIGKMLKKIGFQDVTQYNSGDADIQKADYSQIQFDTHAYDLQMTKRLTEKEKNQFLKNGEKNLPQTSLKNLNLIYGKSKEGNEIISVSIDLDDIKDETVAARIESLLQHRGFVKVKEEDQSVRYEVQYEKENK